MKTLVAWLGNTDLNASLSNNPREKDIGPIAQAVKFGKYDYLLLLTNQAKEQVHNYVGWLMSGYDIDISIKAFELSDPTHYRSIYLASTEAIEQLISESGVEPSDLTFHISPGTPQMQTIWVILANTRYPAKLIQTSREREGIQTPEIPFEMAAQFIPMVMKSADENLRKAVAEIPPEGAHFGDIVYRSETMQRAVTLAKKAAPRNLPVLIQGESGTGKELFARAIHAESSRAGMRPVIINCGAIPKDLIESELFGHKAGSFTGASKDRKGAFEAANQSTLFLDEIGELPLEAQVKLLRAIQEGTIKPIGSDTETIVDVRIIAATNRNLSEEVASGRFREDLFYRLAIAVIELPPLRERSGDINLLINHLFTQVTNEHRIDTGSAQKKLTPGARKALQGHSWPGNVRELLNTLRRAILWSDDEEINGTEMLMAILPHAKTPQNPEQILNKNLENPIDLEAVLSDVSAHYLSLAVKKTGGNKAKAAKLLGFNNATTLKNWLVKHRINS